MSEEKKKKWVKFGKVVKKTKGGMCLVVGDPDNKNSQYKYSVDVTIRDGEGKKVASFTNGFLSIFNPRKKPGLTEEQVAKIPESLVSELFFVENND